MAEAILSAGAERIIALIEEQARYHVNLVRGAEKEVRSLAEELKTIRNVLDDAENRRFKDKNINYWLSRLEQTSRDMEDVLDEWDYAILKLQMEEDHRSKKKVCSFIPSASSCLCFKKAAVRHDISKKILNVKEQIDEILKEKDRFSFAISHVPAADPLPESSWRIQSTSLIDIGKVHGRDTDMDLLVTKLTAVNGGSQEKSAGIQVVSIVGMGGLGKTTLAQLVYNNSLVEKCFDLRIWVSVSEPFDLAVISKGILEGIKGISPNANRLDVLFKEVRESVSGKRFLLVLDDVWTEEYNKWEELEKSLGCGGAAGSKILVTTRKETVARIIGTKQNDIHRPGLLSDEDCWLVLRQIAFIGRNDQELFQEFESIGKEIVGKKCNGLPLAAKTLGSLLRVKKNLDDWKNVLSSEIWKMEVAEVELFPHLLLSYNELSPTLKHCFSYCAVFPKDSRIVVEDLIANWMALGYLAGSNDGDMERKGRECFDVLAMHSLFQDFEEDEFDEIEYCKMHDIVHDFAQFLRKSGRVEVVGMNKTTCRACDHLFDSSVNEFSTLYCSEDSSREVCDCLARLRVLSLTEMYFKTIPQGMERLIHLRRLEMHGINKLSCEEVKIIFQLYNLQTLSLLNCSLEEIPMEIKNLIYLRRLDFSGNESLKVLPSEIGNLTQLRCLNLSENKFLKELPSEIGNLTQLRCLNLSENKFLKELPNEIGNLTQLRFLNLRWNKSLKELPMEIKNLIYLRRLDLSGNKSLKELPSEIGNLTQLRCLNLSKNKSLKELPESICGFQELQTLDVSECSSLCRFPEGLAQLTGFRSLIGDFRGGSGRSKLGLLKHLNHLGPSLCLGIRLSCNDINFEEVVEDAREAKLRNKIHIKELRIKFEDEMDENEESSRMRMDVIDALHPHLYLRELCICNYKGPKLPLWMVSPLNQLRNLSLINCGPHLTSLPSLGKLPCLESIYISGMEGLETVGREFLGITTTQGGEEILNTNLLIAFPKLKTLKIYKCAKLKEWEDITAAEEESAALSVMPCLARLHIRCCDGLTALPHRLLRKASSLEELYISNSKELEQRYKDKDGIHIPI